MEVLKFIYNETEIEFQPTRNDLMVNATEMAKIFDRETKDFNKLDSTQKFINACIISEEKSLIDLKSKDDLIVSVKNSGPLKKN